MPVVDPDDRELWISLGGALENLLVADGQPTAPPLSLGDIVLVEPVKEARARGVLHSVRPFGRFTPTGIVWADGRAEAVDAVIWCTGFRPATDHLRGLGVVQADERVATEGKGTRATAVPGLWLVGYGSWTGFASATLIGVGRSAQTTVDEVRDFLTADAAAAAGRST